MARFATFRADYAAGADIDLYVYRDGTLIGMGVSTIRRRGVTVTAAAPTRCTWCRRGAPGDHWT